MNFREYIDILLLLFLTNQVIHKNAYIVRVTKFTECFIN